MGKKEFGGLPTEVVRSERRVIKTITIEVICDDEDVPVKGNCSAIDDKTDEKQARWIEHQLENGNPWAWCNVLVKATMDDATGAEALGCCSYLSGKDFTRESLYFLDMVRGAVTEMLEVWAKQKQ